MLHHELLHLLKSSVNPLASATNAFAASVAWQQSSLLRWCTPTRSITSFRSSNGSKTARVCCSSSAVCCAATCSGGNSSSNSGSSSGRFAAASGRYTAAAEPGTCKWFSCSSSSPCWPSSLLEPAAFNAQQQQQQTRAAVAWATAAACTRNGICFCRSSTSSSSAGQVLPACRSNSSWIANIYNGSSRCITTKPHKHPQDEKTDGQLQQQETDTKSYAELRRVMEEAGLGFSALMAVLQHRPRRILNPEVVKVHIQELQESFGRSLTNDMLTLAPYLLERSGLRLKAHFDGMVEVFGQGEQFMLDLVRRCPDLLASKPEIIRNKLQLLGQMLQVDQPQVVRLASRAPTVLKSRSSKIQAHIEYLAEVGGLEPRDVYKAYVSWPVLATTSMALIKARYVALSRLLCASPAEMSRICRVFPNMLGRDTNQLDANITTLANQLGIPKEQMLCYMRKEPGLLSWNVSTLVTRVMAVSQMLKLPEERALTLLSYNRPLLTNLQMLPHKMQQLQKVLGVTEEELYPIVHKYMPILRFPVSAVEAKVACMFSIVQLHQPWREEWDRLAALSKLRVIQAGWSCHWRLVYLLHSGQQDTSSAFRALRMPHAKFAHHYPDYPQWLGRYNALTKDKNVSILPAQLAHDSSGSSSSSSMLTLEGAACFEPILLDVSMGSKSLSAGSWFIRDRDAALNQQTPNMHSGLGPSSSSSVTQPAAAAVAVHDLGSRLPGTPAGHLAAWLGIDLAAAEQLLGRKGFQRLTRAQWQNKFAAAAKYLDAVGYIQQQSSSGSSSSSDSVKGGSSSDAHGRDGSFVNKKQTKHVSAEQQQQQLMCMQIAQQLLQQAEAYAHQQQQHISSSAVLQPLPAAQEVLQHALSTQQSAAVAAVSIACNVAPLARQLYQHSPRPPDCTVQLALQFPDAFVREPFESNCTQLAALVKASPYMQQQLDGLPLKHLADYATCAQPRMKYVQYLVETEQPTPWVFDLRTLLLGCAWYTRKGERFVAAYPGFVQWEQARRKL